MAYLDHAATTPMLPQAREAWLSQSRKFGNAQSLHASGRAARRVVEEARESIAGDLGVRPSEVIFTSGGTESDNLALQGMVRAARARGVVRPRVAVSSVEHHAMLDPAEWLARHDDVDLVLLPVDRVGRVDAAAVASLLEKPDDVAACSVMWANNEVGTVQPVEELAAMCRAAGVPFHTDAVQAVATLPVDASRVDSLTLSGHKLGGPTGIGVLTVSRDIDVSPLMLGGGQERDPRPGTPDVASAWALAIALRLAVEAREEHARQLRELRARLVAGIVATVPQAMANGDPEPGGTVPGIVHLSFPGCEGDALLMLLDAAGVEVSTGSACSSGVPEPSHVLLAMGVDERLARGSLRISMGRSSTPGDIDRLLEVLPAAVERAERAGLTGSSLGRPRRDEAGD